VPVAVDGIIVKMWVVTVERLTPDWGTVPAVVA
jgi:hypothetical protein